MFKFITLIFLLFSSTAIAEDKRDGRYVTPDGSPFQFKERHKLFGNMYFTGEATIKVDYKIFREFNYDAGKKVYLRLYVYPDSESIKTLPYQYYHKKKAIPNEIIIENGNKFVPELIDKKTINILLNNDKTLSGKATIIIKEYYAGGECDNPFYMAAIKKIVKTEKKIQYVKNYVGGC